MLNRRKFSSLLLATPLLGTPLLARAASVPYKDLGQLEPATGNKVDVYEFFWYNCIHCYNQYTSISSWAKQNATKINLILVPVQFRDFFEPQQRLFYTLEALKALDEYHLKAFEDIHKNKINLNTQQEIYGWVKKHTSLDIKSFMKYFESYTIAQKALKAKELTDKFKVASTPSFGVGGRYYVDANLAQPRKVQDVILELVDKIKGK